MVKSADRVFQILEVIGLNKPGLTHTEIAEALSIPKSSLSALLNNLVAREYLVFSARSKRYFLGPQLLVLAGRFLDSLDIVQAGRQFMRDLSRLTGESVGMAIMQGNEAVFVGRENFYQPIMSTLEIGDRVPLYATAAGKAILAFKPFSEIERYIAAVEFIQITPNTVTNPDILREELKKVREKGVAYSFQGFEVGVTAVGAPVFDLYGHPVASLAVSAPSFRIDAEKLSLIEKAVLEVSSAFSRQLGFDGIPGRGIRFGGSDGQNSPGRILENG